MSTLDPLTTVVHPRASSPTHAIGRPPNRFLRHSVRFKLIRKPDSLAHIHLFLVPKLTSKASTNLGAIHYDADWIREMIWEQGATAAIPSKSNRKLPQTFDKALYKNRNQIEKFFGRIKRSFRRIATRYDKTSRNFMAFLNLTTLRLWCQHYESAT